jgi:hypothetical protein
MIAFIAGILVGLVFGIAVVSLCVAARRGDAGMGREG